MNPQNDRFYVALGTCKKHVPVKCLPKTHSTFSRSVMVSVAVSSLGSTELVFVEPGTKVDGTYYCNVLLTQHLLPAIKWMSGGHFIFQQDSVPHTKHKKTLLYFLERMDFIPPRLRPPNSPDLNPADYHVWIILEQRVYCTCNHDVSHLKTRLVEEWQKFDQKINDWVIKQWHPSLRSCIQQGGGHFAHRL